MMILVVDDDAAVGEALIALFGQTGDAVRWADSGAVALALAAAEPPDVALVDLCLADGLSLGLLPRLRPARVYVLTASHPSPSLRAVIAGAGALAVLDKSIDPARLVELVRCGNGEARAGRGR